MLVLGAWVLSKVFFDPILTHEKGLDWREHTVDSYYNFLNLQLQMRYIIHETDFSMLVSKDAARPIGDGRSYGFL